MLLEFSANDLLQSRVVEPAWYRVHIDQVEDRLSKDGMSTNSWIKGHIICNADTGDKKFENVPSPFLWMINSKGAFAAVGLFAALGLEIAEGTRADTKALEGKELDVFIGNELYNGIMQNKIEGKYRAVR